MKKGQVNGQICLFSSIGKVKDLPYTGRLRKNLKNFLFLPTIKNKKSVVNIKIIDIIRT